MAYVSNRSLNIWDKCYRKRFRTIDVLEQFKQFAFDLFVIHLTLPLIMTKFQKKELIETYIGRCEPFTCLLEVDLPLNVLKSSPFSF